MISKKCIAIFSYFFLCFIISPTIANAEEMTYIYDDANLLSTSEEEELSALCEEYYYTVDAAMVIVTHDDAYAEDAYYYAENFYDTHSFGNAVILLIDMANRDVVIQGYGLCETYIHSKRGDIIIDSITPDLTAGYYYDAFLSFINQSKDYMLDDSELNYDHNYNYDSNGQLLTNTNIRYGYRTTDRIIFNPIVQILFSMVVSAIIVGCMVGSSGGKVTTNSRTYLDHGASKLVGRRDHYIKTSVTKVRRPQSDNNNRSGGGFNSGGFRGGRSSGGHSHSSSRGKF